MEIDNILDALAMDDVEEIIQLCNCTYNGKTVEFRLINDDIGVVDEIEYKVDDENWSQEYPGELDETTEMIVIAIENAPYDVFHKSDVGAKLNLNHERITPQNLPEHFKSELYVDDVNKPIVITLEKNIVTLSK